MAIKPLLVVATAAMITASPANASQTCQIDKAQVLFGRSPRPNLLIARLLNSCVTLGSRDSRVFLLQGVMARDEGRLAEAAALFEKARELNPGDPSATLELAVTQEWRHQPQAARALYEQILANDPHSRPAWLGLARVALSQTELAEARAIYTRLLTANPNDIEARNGMAWAAMADHHLDEARIGFQGVLTTQPGNPTASEGLKVLESAWRYQLDVTGSYISSNGQSAWGSGASLLTYIDALNQIEIAQYHFSNQIASVGIVHQTLLPINDDRIGYKFQVPGSYNFNVIYDYRDHGSLPSEHWVSASAGSYLTNSLQWFAGYRLSFGAPEWDGGLARAGFIVTLLDTWEAVGTVYQDYYHVPGVRNLYTDVHNSWAFGVDVNRQGPGASFFNLGVGYGPDVNNLDLHARWVVPVSTQWSLQALAQHSTVNNGYQATLGTRFNW